MDARRLTGDPAADSLYWQIREAGQQAAVNRVMAALHQNANDLPATAFSPLAQYLQASRQMPDDVDRRRLERGQQVFARHGVNAILILLCKSLPSGYGAPCLSEVLALSGLLQKQTYRRLLGVLQMVIDVVARGAFAPEGKAIATAQKLRLLHAGVRQIALDRMPTYVEQHGLPCNQEDMLATIMGFSLCVIEGWRQLGNHIDPQSEEDYFYVWMVFGELMGIEAAFVPKTVAEAGEFYSGYATRQMRPAAANPQGQVLTQQTLRMMVELLPVWMRRAGFDVAPQYYTHLLLGPAAAERVGVAAVTKHLRFQGMLGQLPSLEGLQLPVVDDAFRAVHERLVRGILRSMIAKAYEGQPTFLVPSDLMDLWRLQHRAK